MIILVEHFFTYIYLKKLLKDVMLNYVFRMQKYYYPDYFIKHKKKKMFFVSIPRSKKIINILFLILTMNFRKIALGNLSLFNI